MKRMICLLLALLGLLGCACGKKKAREEPVLPAPVQSQAPAAPAPTAAPVQRFPRSSYHSVEITPDNWQQYFRLAEIPLYTVSGRGSEGEDGQGVIAAVRQNYCVVLRDEYLPYLDPEEGYSVRFSFSFDLYIDSQLAIDTQRYTYKHSEDLLYAVQTTKEAVFDHKALSALDYGGEFRDHQDYQNAFFSGDARMNLDENGQARTNVNDKIWSGFYVDLSRVSLESVEGSISLALS